MPRLGFLFVASIGNCCLPSANQLVFHRTGLPEDVKQEKQKKQKKFSSRARSYIGTRFVLALAWHGVRLFRGMECTDAVVVVLWRGGLLLWFGLVPLPLPCCRLVRFVGFHHPLARSPKHRQPQPQLSPSTFPHMFDNMDFRTYRTHCLPIPSSWGWR